MVLTCDFSHKIVYLVVLSICITVALADKAKSSEAEKVKDNDDFDTNLYKSYYTPDKRKISIYNNFLKPSSYYFLRRYLFNIGQWEVTLNDYNNGSNYKQDSPDHVLWKIYPDPQFLEKSKIGQKLLRAVKHFGSDQDYHIYHAAAKLVARSEIPVSSIDAPAGDGDISAIIYLITKWKKNDYGDIIFYDDQKEITCAVHPQMLRMIMFDSSIEHLYKPPSVDHEGPLITLQVKLTQSTDKLNRAVEEWKTRSQNRLKERNTKLNDIAPVSSARVIDVEKHITRQFVGRNGKKIYVLDNIYTPQELQNLRNLVEYKRYDHDGNFDEGSDGVSWAATFTLQDFVDSNLWNIHQQVVKHVGSRDSYFPYDISCNMIKSNDRTRVHDDCAQLADQWTMVTYLNPNWTAEMGGETAYFERNTDDGHYITEVRPRYGRSVIFQSTIYHSARPPSNNFNGIRYTFSVKMAEDETQARLNRLSEDYSIYAGNVEQRESIKRIGKILGRKKAEEMILGLLLGEDEPIKEPNSKNDQADEEDDDDEDMPEVAQSPSKQQPEQAPTDQGDHEAEKADENHKPRIPMDAMKNPTETPTDQGDHDAGEVDAYRNPHRTLSEITNPTEARKRQKLIKTLDKYRDNAKIIAKLQNSLEENMLNSYIKVAEQIVKHL